MKIKKISNFKNFCEGLLAAGFSIGGENDEGIFTLNSYLNDNINWHTEDPETDPWEWRMRVLNERDDIAYGKLFFNKSGYITKEWYPYFLSVRRDGKSFETAYQDGTISHTSKRIYDLIKQSEELPLHIIKQQARFGSAEKSAFDKALTELQMRMFITMCGRSRKKTKEGAEYGWSSTMFCTVENFFDNDVFIKANSLSKDEAIAKITERIYELNPNVVEKKISKFIGG